MDKNSILNLILDMKLGEIDTIKLTDNRFLFIDNWGDEEESFTSLELNAGYEEDNSYILDDVLECGTYNFQDRKDIESGIEYIIACI